MSQKCMFDFIKGQREEIFFSLAFLGFFLLSSFIFQLSRNFILYMFLVGLSLLLVYLSLSYILWRKRHKELLRWLNQGEYCLEGKDWDPEKELLAQKIVELHKKSKEQIRVQEEKNQSLKDYITIWTHQIKSPLFALRLILKDSEPDIFQANREVFEMEEYIQNILGYIRLESEKTDYVFSRQSLDEMLQATIRKYSFLCIGKKNQIDFQETGVEILTDSKWFVFMLEQIFSNAIKYTQEGKISIFMEGDTLCVKDTGIGIRQEDLPRIFDPGYTGYNGRLGNKSTGIGLNLVQAIGKNLGVEVSVSSRLGEGTCCRMKVKRLKSFK